MLNTILVAFLYKTYIAPGVVQFHLKRLNNTEVIVMWSPPLQPNGVITSYEVIHQMYEDDNSASVHTRLESTDRSYFIQNLRKLRVSSSFYGI